MSRKQKGDEHHAHAANNINSGVDQRSPQLLLVVDVSDIMVGTHLLAVVNGVGVCLCYDSFVLVIIMTSRSACVACCLDDDVSGFCSIGFLCTGTNGQKGHKSRNPASSNQRFLANARKQPPFSHKIK